jgi:N-formylglutamate amidohydrolase
MSSNQTENGANAMAWTRTAGPSGDPVCEVLAPAQQTMAAVFASPHSGNHYPPEFIAASRLDPKALRKSEDSFIDQLFGMAPDHGAPLLRALFPRAYIDPNREPFELDPDMFEDALPDYVNAHTPRVAGGLGTIARVVANGEEIYKRKLRFDEAATRINRLYHPYHRHLQNLIARTQDRFGYCLLVDCHSMPSIGGPMDQDAGLKRVDLVLGDCFGTSCAPTITALTDEVMRDLGYRVTRNMPYSGGFTTMHYGQPASGVHALQIEINRALYMEEDRFQPTMRFDALRAHLGVLIETLKVNLPKLLAKRAAE